MRKTIFMSLFLGSKLFFANSLYAENHSDLTGYITIFLESVVCQQLPVGTCEALNVGNAKNLLLSVQAQLLQKNCGTRNLTQAIHLQKAGNLLNPKKCAELISHLKMARGSCNQHHRDCKSDLGRRGAIVECRTLVEGRIKCGGNLSCISKKAKKSKEICAGKSADPCRHIMMIKCN